MTRKIKASGALGVQEKTSTTLSRNSRRTSLQPLKTTGRDSKEKKLTERKKSYYIPSPLMKRVVFSRRDHETRADPAG